MIQATAHRYVVTNDQILGGEPIIEGTPHRHPGQSWSYGGKVWRRSPSRHGCRI